MPDGETQDEVDKANARVISDLRKAFQELTGRLPVELEPAPVYSAHVRLIEDIAG